eukprot:441060-Rhodomonas_salina.1
MGTPVSGDDLVGKVSPRCEKLLKALRGKSIDLAATGTRENNELDKLVRCECKAQVSARVRASRCPVLTLRMGGPERVCRTPSKVFSVPPVSSNTGPHVWSVTLGTDIGCGGTRAVMSV